MEQTKGLFCTCDSGDSLSIPTPVSLLANEFHARIQKFSSGGVQVNLTQKSSVNVFFFEENYHFSRFKRGSNIFQGVQLFPGGGGPIAYSL